MYLLCVALPLLTVFRQHLKEIPKVMRTPYQSESRQQYVDRLSAIEQTEADEEIRRVSELNHDEVVQFTGE